jgi:hypothetical protein
MAGKEFRSANLEEQIFACPSVPFKWLKSPRQKDGGQANSVADKDGKME